MRIQTIYIVFFCFCFSYSQESKILNIGHRGAKGYVAENTIASISKAIELGVDGVEIDVFRCSTGELVVFHDKTLEKLTNGSGFIEELTLDSIKKIKVLGKEKIPTLIEVMNFIDSRIILNIELKGKNTAIPTAKLLNNYFFNSSMDKDKIFISSFDFNELKIFSDQKTNFKVALLTDSNENPLNFILKAKEINAFAINPNFKTLSTKNVNEIKKNGLKIYTWTVNSLKEINKMKSLGVNGIISDFPDRVNPKY
jgi:glycerophosphoryl diester phosphodiesterase